jgi:hypothetical protein
MTNKEQIQRDFAVALDFVEQIIDNPTLLDLIPQEAAITFLDEGNRKIEKHSNDVSGKKYVKVKRHFEVL